MSVAPPKYFVSGLHSMTESDSFHLLNFCQAPPTPSKSACSALNKVCASTTEVAEIDLDQVASFHPFCLNETTKQDKLTGP
jgi:hypothetical protein